MHKELRKTRKELDSVRSDAENDDISIDFSGIKKFFKNLGSGDKPKVNDKAEDEEVSVDWKATGQFFVKYSTVLLLLIPILLSIFFRMYPAYLPITDDWAQNAVQNSIKNSIVSQINQQYPNLPAENKDLSYYIPGLQTCTLRGNDGRALSQASLFYCTVCERE